MPADAENTAYTRAMERRKFPAGWYPDPEGSGQSRYWDGTSWAPAETSAEPRSAEARRQILAAQIQSAAIQGWRLETQTEETAFFITEPKSPNHVLHGIVSVLTLGLWLFVWLFIALAKPVKHRMMVSVDEAGNVRWQKLGHTA